MRTPPNLTETAIKRAIAKAQTAAKPTTIHDGMVRGLFLLLKPTGAKLWRLVYRAPDGRRRWLSLGHLGAVSLDEARNLGREALEMLKMGKDPAEIRKARPRQIQALFGDYARQWVASQVAWSTSHLTDVQQKLRSHVYPYIEKLPPAQVSRESIKSILDILATKGQYATLSKVKINISQVLRYAAALGVPDVVDWTKMFDRLYKIPKPHHRARLVKREDVSDMMKAIASYRAKNVITGLALKFSAYTFARPGEIRQAEWKEISWTDRLWRLPAAKMKARAEHLVPLADQILALLAELKPLTSYSDYLFPSNRTKSRPMSEATILAALRRMGYSQEQMTAHGFRGTASTILNEKGWNRDWIEAQLAHAERNAVRAAYNGSDFLDDRRLMMQWWANYLDALETDSDPPIIPWKK